MKNKIISSLVFGLLLFPAFTFAQFGTSLVNQYAINNAGPCNLVRNPKFHDVANYVTNCIIQGALIPLLFAIAIVFFLWGVVQYVINNDDEAKKEKGKQVMIWGIIGLTVMLGMWGLVAILGGTFGLNTGPLPQVRPN